MRLPNYDGGFAIPYLTYDPALKEIFVSNPDIDAVEVYSTVDGHFVGEVGIPGPAGLSFSPDFSKLAVGTITPHVYFVDPVALHVNGNLEIPASSLISNQQGDTLMPVMPYTMADGSLFLGLGNSFQSGSSWNISVVNLVRYDPSNGTFTPEDPGPGGVSANPALSLDGKHLLVFGEGNAGLQLFLYSTDAEAYVATGSGLQKRATILRLTMTVHNLQQSSKYLPRET